MSKTVLSISPEAKKFLVNLLEEAGMDIVPGKIRDKMLADLAKRLDTRLTLAALAALPEDKRDRFEDMLSENNPVLEMTDYFSENVPNIAEVYAKALVEFKRSYLS